MNECLKCQFKPQFPKIPVANSVETGSQNQLKLIFDQLLVSESSFGNVDFYAIFVQ